MLSTEGTGSLDRLIDGLLAELPGTLEPMVRAAIWDTVEDFCVRSGCFRRVVAVSVGSSGSTTTVVSPEGEVQHLVEVYGIDRYRIEQPDKVISLGASASGTALVSLRPTNLDATPVFIFETWFRPLRVGALARLLSEPSKPYTNLEVAGPYLQLYEAEIARVLLEAAQVVSQAVGEPDGLDRLYANVFAEVPLVPHTHIQMMAWNTIEDFCGRSGWYRKTVEWSLVDADTQVQLTSPDGLVNEVVEVYGLEQYRVEQPDRLIPLEPTEASGTALVTLQPVDLAHVPEVLFQTWLETLRSGVLARLLAEAGQPWANPERAALFAAAYEAGVALAGGQKPQVVSPQALKPDSFDRLYSNIYAELPDVPHTQVQLALWNTLEEFFIQSTTRREHVFWQMAPGISWVDFNPFDGDWDVAWILNYTGLYYGKIEPPSLLRDLTPPPVDARRTGQAWLALKPKDFLSDVGSLVWSQWFNYIKAGTLTGLYGQPGKPYSSPQLATFYGRRFRSGIVHARSFAAMQYTDGSAWRFPYFASGRRKS